MGNSDSKQLPAASEEDIARLQEKGHLVCVAIPAVDIEGRNNLQTIYYAEYENGTEITLLFKDEDRPNALLDGVYDTIRKPLFGRKSDIETIFIIKDSVEFPGTYAGKQEWNEKIPKHEEATVELSKFEKKEKDPVLWINTWNHLIGESNNNTSEEIVYSRPLAANSTESSSTTDYVARKGSREEVDGMFKGLKKSFNTVVTPERAEKLGKRLL